MSDIKLADAKCEGADSWMISLVKLTGLCIKDMRGYLSEEFGDVIFKICEIVLEDGTEIGVEGEHDFPYLSPYGPQPVPNFDDETLERLRAEAAHEDGEDDEE